MKAILNRYEQISGQAINYTKSNIIFSPNTSITDKRIVCDRLGLGEAILPGKYVGMPMYVGKNKAEDFGILTDRVRQNLQGWMNKEISKAGKITLLKSAAQIIPNFWMSIFILPSSICEAIEKVMNVLVGDEV